jgi:large subunit ribosomal protein L33
MSQDNLVILKNKETGEVYWSRKNRKQTDNKLELKKFSKKLRKVITFKESKK